MTDNTTDYSEEVESIVTATNDTDTTDYKALFEKEKAEKETRENRFKGTAKQLNDLKKSITTYEEVDDGVSGANEYLKTTGSKVLREELGFISRDDIDTLLDARLQHMKQVEKLDKFPQLSDQKEAILQLSKVDGLSIEETIKKYKFLNEDGMENFHRPIAGNRKKVAGPIDVNNPTQDDIEAIKKMSPEEFDKFLKSQ